MNERMTKPLWQIFLDDRFCGLRHLTADQRQQLERQMIADTRTNHDNEVELKADD